MSEDTDVKRTARKTLASWAMALSAIGALASAPWVLAPRAAPQDVERVRALEVRVDGIERRLDRIETKIDLLLERK